MPSVLSKQMKLWKMDVQREMNNQSRIMMQKLILRSILVTRGLCSKCLNQAGIQLLFSVITMILSTFQSHLQSFIFHLSKNLMCRKEMR